MKKQDLLLFTTIALICATSTLLAGDVTESFYFGRAAFGAGSTTTISSCNTGSTTVVERVIFRDGTSGQAIHDEQSQLQGSRCNVTNLQEGNTLRVGFVEIRITGPEDVEVISSLFMQLSVGGSTTDEVRINPEEATMNFDVNFSEKAESRNGIAIADTTGSGFNCSVQYRDSSGTLIQGQAIQAGANQGSGLFFDEVIPGLPDGFGWAAFDCSAEIAATTLGQNPVSGNLSVGSVFPSSGSSSNGGGGDITDRIFTERSADCGSYVGEYSANVMDIQRGLGFVADISITATQSACVIASNSIPNHDFNDQIADFGENVSEVQGALTISRNPTMAGTATDLVSSTFDAVMLNGVAVDLLSEGCYSPNSPNARPDGTVLIGCRGNVIWRLDPLGTDHRFGADSHNAHTQPDGRYHYHGGPMAMFDDNPGANGSPVIGFAADGFPIYGTYFRDGGTVRKAVSGYTLRSGMRPGGMGNPGGTYDGTYVDDYQFTNAGDLDECNGMAVDGQYAYYVTDGYPWVVGCLSGSPHASFNK